MPRKGTATVKKKSKADRYVYCDDDDSLSDEELPDSPTRGARVDSHARDMPHPPKGAPDTSDSENIDPASAREQQKLPNEAQPRQPRQDAPMVTAEQSAALAESLFPNHQDAVSAANDDDDTAPPQTVATPNKRARNKQLCAVLDTRSSSSRSSSASAAALARRTKKLLLTPAKKSPPAKRCSPPPEAHLIDQDNNTTLEEADPPNMIQGGAHIPPNQQRNMRACMVCSIVRTQQQFATQGCPNCEEILELAGNPEQINDCTSQVFEGLITVADTSRSWVARYQRLEGYVPGVYATQVEGILPEDVLSAVESAGVNYVPRDGSEQEMLGKD